MCIRFFIFFLFSLVSFFSQAQILEQFTPFKEVELRGMVTDDNGVVYAATTGGVYVSNDNGDNWILNNTGLSIVENELIPISNTGNGIWYLNSKLFFANRTGVLFQLIDGRWENVLTEYLVFDIDFFDDRYFFAGKHHNTVGFGFSIYEVVDMESEPSHFRSQGSTFFNFAHPITNVGDALVFATNSEIALYDGEEFRSISHPEGFTAVHVAGTASDNIFMGVFSFFLPSATFPLQNFFKYDGVSWTEEQVTPGNPFFARSVFELNGEIYTAGIDQGVSLESVLVKNEELLLLSTWEPTTGYTEGHAPVVQQITETANGNFLYHGVDFIRHSTSTMGNANTLKESGIFNGSVEQLAFFQDKFYFIDGDKKIQAVDAEGNSLGVIPANKNQNFFHVGQADQRFIALSGTHHDSRLTVLSQKASEQNLRLDEFSLFGAKDLRSDPVGVSNGKIDLVDSDISTEKPFKYFVIDIDNKTVSQPSMPNPDTTKIDRVHRAGGYTFAVSSYVEHSYDRDGGSASATYYGYPWAVYFKSHLGFWREFSPDIELSVQTGQFYGLEEDADGNVFLFSYVFDYRTSTRETQLYQFNYEIGKFEFVRSYSLRLRDIAYANGKWFALESGTTPYTSTNLIEWKPMNLSGLPEAAEIVKFMLLGDALFCSTDGNGVFYQQSSGTGIQDKAQDLGITFSLFPNPAQDAITVSSNGWNFNQIDIYGVSGRLEKSVLFDNATNKREVTVNDLPVGAYVLKISGEQGAVARQFIKN